MRPIARNRGAVGAERLVRVRGVERIAERREIANALERKGRRADALEVPVRGDRARRERYGVVVAVGIELGAGRGRRGGGGG